MPKMDISIYVSAPKDGAQTTPFAANFIPALVIFLYYRTLYREYLFIEVH
jgi:hypothetical protein